MWHAYLARGFTGGTPVPLQTVPLLARLIDRGVRRCGDSTFRNPKDFFTLMRNHLKTVLAVLLVAAAAVVFTKSYGQKADGGAMPRVFLLDAKQVQLTRQRIRDGDKSLTAAWARLEREAQKALTEGPFS